MECTKYYISALDMYFCYCSLLIFSFYYKKLAQRIIGCKMFHFKTFDCILCSYVGGLDFVQAVNRSVVTAVTFTYV